MAMCCQPHNLDKNTPDKLLACRLHQPSRSLGDSSSAHVYYRALVHTNVRANHSCAGSICLKLKMVTKLRSYSFLTKISTCTKFQLNRTYLGLPRLAKI